MGQNILIEISARHIHLSKEHLEILFGEGYELTVKKMLSQPGQFACEERVSVIGPKGKFSMSVLGPVRERTQVEISLTDARTIGVSAPYGNPAMWREAAAVYWKAPGERLF